MTPIHEAYYAFKRADDAWQSELVKQFGKRAGDVRYTARGHEGETLASLHAEFQRTGKKWRHLCQVARGEKPVD